MYPPWTEEGTIYPCWNGGATINPPWTGGATIYPACIGGPSMVENSPCVLLRSSVVLYQRHCL
jgi:hypothetical protein